MPLRHCPSAPRTSKLELSVPFYLLPTRRDFCHRPIMHSRLPNARMRPYSASTSLHPPRRATAPYTTTKLPHLLSWTMTPVTAGKTTPRTRARLDLSLAVTSHPMYGRFATLYFGASDGNPRSDVIRDLCFTMRQGAHHISYQDREAASTIVCRELPLFARSPSLVGWARFYHLRRKNLSAGTDA